MKLVRNSGFTLVELAVLLICMGFLLSGAMVAYKSYTDRIDMVQTQSSLDLMTAALLEYRDNNGHYPLPARLDLGPNDIGYGEEYDNTLINPTPGSCESGICRVLGRDVDSNTVKENVLIGEVPFNTLNEENIYSTVTAHHTHDAWGQKIRYAITENLTAKVTFSSFQGAIYVYDENGNSVLVDDGVAHFFLASSGASGKGAYDKNGNIRKQCTSSFTTDEYGNPLPANPSFSQIEKDLENCDDHDAEFISGLFSSAEDSRDHFDDFVSFQAWSARDVWSYSPYDTSSIYNTNKGDVGVDNPNPQFKFDISNESGSTGAFTLRADSISVDPKGGDANSDYEITPDNCITANGEDCGLCEGENEKYCMPVEILTGNLTQMDCGPNHVVQKIGLNKVYCKPVIISFPTGVDCSSHGGIQEYYLSGKVVCADGTVAAN